MNTNEYHREAIVKALILCTNVYLEMDIDSSDEDVEGHVVESDNGGPSDVSIATVGPMIIPKWSGDEYKAYLKISAGTFEFVYQLLAPRLRRLCHGMPMVDARLQIMVAIHKLTSINTYRDASAAFNMKKSTGYSCTNRVINALYTLSPAFIQWPAVAKGFQELSDFPGVLGNIGLCRLRMLEFLDRGSKDGVLLQVICDSKQKIIHCGITPPDTDLLQHSGIAQYLDDSNKFPHNTHLIANNSYPLHKNIMVPYLEENNDAQRNFNKKLKSAFVIHKCLDSLVSRFESLGRGLSLNDKSNKRHVVACCVLHNICILKDDLYEGTGNNLAVDRTSSIPCPKGVLKRDRISQELPMG